MSKHPATLAPEDFAIGEWVITVIYNARKHYSKNGDPRTQHINLGKMSPQKALAAFCEKSTEVSTMTGRVASDRRVTLHRRTRGQRVLVGGFGYVRKSFESFATFHTTDRLVDGSYRWIDNKALRGNTNDSGWRVL